MRGTWKVVSVEVGGSVDPSHPAIGKVQRIEQAGNRVIVTAAGIVHDMRCDGTEEHGVHDVAEFDKTTPITVVATFEDGVHILRPVGVPIEVTRRIDGDQLVWTLCRVHRSARTDLSVDRTSRRTGGAGRGVAQRGDGAERRYLVREACGRGHQHRHRALRRRGDP